MDNQLLIRDAYKLIKPSLDEIADQLHNNINDLFKQVEHIDKTMVRVKDINSFVDKATKVKNGEMRYKQPFVEIQDLIGARIVVFYKNDIKEVRNIIEKGYNPVETKVLIPEEESEFGYEGLHYILFLPPCIAGKYRNILNIPTFFELQVKTLGSSRKSVGKLSIIISP